MKKYLLIAAAFGFISTVSACKSTSSVEIYRVTSHDDIINLGHNQENGLASYGHFRSINQFDRASASVIHPNGKSNVCYINIDEGQVNGGNGNGFRVEPCQKIILVNEGQVSGDLDNLALLYYETDTDLAVYKLYAFENDTFKCLVNRTVSSDLLNTNPDILKKLEDGSLQLTFTLDGNSQTQIISRDELLNGSALEFTHVESTPSSTDVVPETTTTTNER